MSTESPISSAADLMPGEPADLGVLAARAEELARTQEDDRRERRVIELLEVEVGGARFAVPFDGLDEVVPRPVPVQVPGTPDWVLGVINLEGTLLTVLDLSLLLGLGEPMPDPEGVLVASEDNVRAGLAVGRIVGATECGVADIQPPPPGHRGRYIRGIANETVALIDVSALLNSPDVLVDAG